MSKKTRGPNFSSNEKEILVHLITKYKDVVENKKTDAATTATKAEGWRKITNEFNCISSFSVRNTDQLKTCWDNIKRNTRKDKARAKKEIIFTTGGGKPNLPPPGMFQGQVEVILGPTLNGLENKFDSDAQCLEQNTLEDTTTSIFVENEIEVVDVEPVTDPSTMPDACSKVAEEDEITGQVESECRNKQDERLIEVLEEDKKMWNSWSPAALKNKISQPLKKDSSSSWLMRRRPKASFHDKLLQSKLELIEMMKKNCEVEAKKKNLILDEQLKQEKIKTETMALALQRAKENKE